MKTYFEISYGKVIQFGYILCRTTMHACSINITVFTISIFCMFFSCLIIANFADTN